MAKSQGYDLIGDVHGCMMTLVKLLEQLGYRKQNGVYQHASRKAIFIGDIVDRGPRIREALHIVRDMVEHGAAHIVMGNHEYNALCFHFQETEGGHLRQHLIKNIIQHYETLKHNGDFPIIGVNTFLSSKGSPTILPAEVIRATEEEKQQNEEEDQMRRNYRNGRLRTIESLNDHHE